MKRGYVQSDLLGRGALSEVYKVTLDDQSYALKRIYNDALNDASYSEGVKR